MKKKRTTRTDDGHARARDLGVCIALMTLTAAVFLPVRTFEFLLYDDASVVFENPNVASGLKWENIVWAFTHAHFAIWMPLTSLSHMFDASVFGRWAGGHHLTSLLLHTLAAAVLYLALNCLTRRPWPSALCAALFAVHPQRAEAVGWISSRKEILCGLFFFAAVWAYARYARGATLRRLGLVVLFAALALMSKPMAVTLPFVLLLLDWWPLERFSNQRLRRTVVAGLLLEKVPLFVLAAATAIVATATQPEVSQITSVTGPPFAARAGNAAINCAAYLFHSLYPVALAAHYPLLPDTITGARVAGAGVLLGLITVAAVILRKKKYLAVGWLWFVGALIPVLGLVQYGNAAMADRYTYIPHAGLLLMIVWALADAVAWMRARHAGPARPEFGNRAAVAAAVLVLAAGAVLCRWQLGFWRDTERLFERNIAVQPQSALAHANLGMAALQKGHKDAALRYYREAVRLEPAHAIWLYNLGSMLVLIEHYHEAADLLRRSLELNPNNPPAWGNLGVCELESGNTEAALRDFDEALRLNPNKASYLLNRADALAKLGRHAEAVEALERANALEPDSRDAAARLDRARRAASQAAPHETN